jgi:tetratricopeptide (TPR) repeat protein
MRILTLFGGAYDVLGDFAQATSYYEQALAIVRSEGIRGGTEGSALNNIGQIYHDLGDWQNALKYYQQSLPIFQTIGDRDREGNTLSNIGVVYFHLGDINTSLDYLQRSLAIRRSIGDKDGQAYTLTSMGNVYRLENKRDEAIEFYNDALALRKAVGDRRAEAATLDYLGTAYSEDGNLDKALATHLQSLELRRATSDLRGQALSLANLGHVYRLLNKPQKAADHEQQALAIYRKIGDMRGVAEALDEQAHAEYDQGQFAQARTHIEETLSIIEEQRSKVAGEDLRASYFALSHDSYLFYVDLLMHLHRQDPSQGYDRKALEVSERARARSLLELLGESRTSIRQGVDPSLAEQEQKLGQLLDAKAARLTQSLGGQETTPELEQLKAEIGELEHGYQEVRAALRKSSPQYAALTQPRTLTVQQIQQQLLDADTVLLEYSLGDTVSYVCAVDQSGVHGYQLPQKKTIEDVARALYQQLTTRDARKEVDVSAREAKRERYAKQLSEMVLGPVRENIRGKRLVIVADGALQYIPFAMLPSPEEGYSARRLLIAQHEIVTLPSISVLAVQRAALENRKNMLEAPEATARIRSASCRVKGRRGMKN